MDRSKQARYGLFRGTSYKDIRTLAALAHQQRLQDIQRMVRAGTYYVPATNLAPILMKIFQSMTNFENHG